MNALALLLKLKGTTQKPCPLANEFIKLPDSSPDMSALACDQFGLNSKTGFLPPQVPLARLPSLFSQWEDALQHAMVVLKRPGDSDDPLLTEEEKTHGLKWRQGIQRVRLSRFKSMLFTEYKIVRSTFCRLHQERHKSISTRPSRPRFPSSVLCPISATVC